MSEHHEGWRDEMRAAWIYRVMAEHERGTVREALFRELAGEAERQAAIWGRKEGGVLPAYVPDTRARIAAALIRRFGPRPVRGILAAMKVRGLSIYSHPMPGHQMPTSIVLTQVGDPVGSGFVTNLARPVGNVTGVSNMVADLSSNRLEILKEMIPSGRRIAAIFNPGDPITVPQVRDVHLWATVLAVEVRLFPVRDTRELPETFAQTHAWKANSAMRLLGQQQLF